MFDLTLFVINFDRFRNVIVTFEKERDATKKAFDLSKKQVDAVLRERDLARKDLAKGNSLYHHTGRMI